MSVNPSGGVRVFIGGPNSNRASVLGDYQADSYIEIGEIEDGGEFGDQSTAINFTALSDGRTRKFKGPRDAGDMTLSVGDDMTDEGQVALEAAEAQSFDYNIKVQLNDKLSLGGEDSTHYFIAKVMSKRRVIGNASAIVKRTFMLGINSPVTSTDPT